MDIANEITKVETKIEALRFKLAVQEKVLSHLQAIQSPNSPTVVIVRKRMRRGSLTSSIESLLKEVKHPMKISEIAKALKSRGVETSSKHGLGPMIASAVRKRKETFDRLDRGLYTLKNQTTEIQETLLE